MQLHSDEIAVERTGWSSDGNEGVPRGRCRTGRTPTTAGRRAPSAADGQGPAPRRGGRPAAVLHVEDLQAGDGQGHPEGGRRPCADPASTTSRATPSARCSCAWCGRVARRAGGRRTPTASQPERFFLDEPGRYAALETDAVALRSFDFGDPARPAADPGLHAGCPLGAAATPLGAGDRAAGRAAAAAPGRLRGARTRCG